MNPAAGVPASSAPWLTASIIPPPRPDHVVTPPRSRAASLLRFLASPKWGWSSGVLVGMDLASNTPTGLPDGYRGVEAANLDEPK